MFQHTKESRLVPWTDTCISDTLTPGARPPASPVTWAVTPTPDPCHQRHPLAWTSWLSPESGQQQPLEGNQSPPLPQKQNDANNKAIKHAPDPPRGAAQGLTPSRSWGSVTHYSIWGKKMVGGIITKERLIFLFFFRAKLSALQNRPNFLLLLSKRWVLLVPCKVHGNIIWISAPFQREKKNLFLSKTIKRWVISV